ncbi:hypothetical protein AAG906_003290 [Vitis piasezkii]
MDRKVSTVTVDNCSSNDGMINILVEKLCLSDSLLLNGKFFHMLCAAHVLNLIVKEGLDVIEVEIEKIRESVAYWSTTPSRMEKFEDAARQLRIPCNKKLSLDCKTRWNSTYLMLSIAITYKDVFPRLKQQLFSGRNYPTANTFFIKVCEIKEALYDWLICSNDVVKTMASSMLQKFDKYWSGCHIIEKIRGMCYELLSEYQSKSNLGQKTSSYGTSSGSTLLELNYDEQDPLSKFDLFVHSTIGESHMKSELDYYFEYCYLLLEKYGIDPKQIGRLEVGSSSWDGLVVCMMRGFLYQVYAKDQLGLLEEHCYCYASRADAPIAFESKLRGSHMSHAYDFYKPNLASMRNWRASNFPFDDDYLVFHSPYNKVVYLVPSCTKSFARLVFNDVVRNAELVRKYGLEISQPGLEPNKGLTWRMTKEEKQRRNQWCPNPHLPPCKDMKSFEQDLDAWRCVWHMLQVLTYVRLLLILLYYLFVSMHDHIGTSSSLKQPAHEKIGVVDSQWIVHQTVPSLGNQGQAENGKAPWQGVRERCKKEWTMFRVRMTNAEKAYYKEMGINPTNSTAD